MVSSCTKYASSRETGRGSTKTELTVMWHRSQVCFPLTLDRYSYEVPIRERQFLSLTVPWLLRHHKNHGKFHYFSNKYANNGIASAILALESPGAYSWRPLVDKILVLIRLQISRFHSSTNVNMPGHKQPALGAGYQPQMLLKLAFIDAITVCWSSR